MKLSFRKLTQEQRVAILEDCAASPLSVRKYAAFQNMGYSTLTRWAAREGIVLTKREKNFPVLQEPISTSNKPAIVNKDTESLPFIDVTPYTKDGKLFSPPPFQDSQEPGGRQTHENTQLSCGIEIHLPNGVTLKVEQVPSFNFWHQAIEFVRAFA